jgi:hypothetical protein
MQLLGLDMWSTNQKFNHLRWPDDSIIKAGRWTQNRDREKLKRDRDWTRSVQESLSTESELFINV